jgi:hypothetical protein
MKRQIILEENHIQALAAFLGRTILKGAEVPLYNAIIRALETSTKYQEPEQPKPEKSK